MKVLLIHSYYQIRGGEDVVFEQESVLLQNDFIVEKLIFKNKAGWRGGLQFVASIWNLNAIKKVKNKIKDFSPDIVHIHNWHFGTGPVIIRTIKQYKIPVILTLHNYRLLCPSAILLSNGKLFTDSIYRSFPWRAVIKKVYHSSYLQTFWLAFIIWLHKKLGTWKMVNKYIALSQFSKDLFLEAKLNIPENSIVVKPNFTNNYKGIDVARDNFFLYVGRLSEEKGVIFLTDVFQKISADLFIAGSGVLQEKVELISKNHSNIHYCGPLESAQVHKLMRKATALIFPSVWYEPFGLTIIEAFAHQLPVIASNIGASEELVKNKLNGLHFSSGNESDLIRVIRYWENLTVDNKLQYSKRAEISYQKFYTPGQNLKHIKNIYKNVLKVYELERYHR